jgi:hypothetical protein
VNGEVEIDEQTQRYQWIFGYAQVVILKLVIVCEGIKVEFVINNFPI